MKDGSLHADVYVMNITEQAPRKLNTGTGEASVPSWSHDGKWIYFIGGGSAGGDRIYRVHSEGGQSTPVSSARGWGPKESLDGRYVYFASSASNGTSLQRASLGPIGTESPVDGIPALSFAANWTIVRDGIYFFPGDDFTTLSFFDFASKQVRQILKGQLVFYGVSVSPDQRYIVYARHEIPKRDVMLVDNFR
jgi:Tol biopolymer transport system component